MKDRLVQPLRPALLRKWQIWVALLLPFLLVNSAQNSGSGEPTYLLLLQQRVDFEMDPASGSCTPGTDCVDCRDNPRTKCMCGNVFLRNQSVEESNETVAECNSILSSNSFLTPEPLDSLSVGLCEDVLNDLNYTVNVSVNGLMSPSSPVVALTEEELSARIESIQRYLTQFILTLNRTIVGVYLRSAEQRCICMEAYKRWLCTTKLPFYTRNKNCSLDDPETECVSLENGMTVERLRPCLSICHRVLQQCPYFNPSEFQQLSVSNMSEFQSLTEDTCPSNNKTSRDEALDIIYGGFPAFDCPDPQLLRLYNRLNESTCETSSYSLAESCIGNGSYAVLHTLSLVRLLLTVLLCALCVSLVY